MTEQLKFKGNNPESLCLMCETSVKTDETGSGFLQADLMIICSSEWTETNLRPLFSPLWFCPVSHKQTCCWSCSSLITRRLQQTGSSNQRPRSFILLEKKLERSSCGLWFRIVDFWIPLILLSYKSDWASPQGLRKCYKLLNEFGVN